MFVGSQLVNTSADILNTSLPITLTCTSTNLSVEWYRNGHKMSAGVDGTSLTVPATGDSSVLGVYQCFIVNITGTAPVSQYRILPYGECYSQEVTVVSQVLKLFFYNNYTVHAWNAI